MGIPLQPDHTVPYPDNLEPEEAPTLRENMQIAANTYTVLEGLGAEIPEEADDDETADAVFQAFNDRAKQQYEAALDPSESDKKNKGGRPRKFNVNPPELYKGAVAERVRSMLNEYNSQLVADASELRLVVTNKLLDLSSCGDPRIELKATEMLGKISDVGLFSEKTEITVTYNSVSDIDAVLKDKIRKMLTLHAQDVTPVLSLEKELGSEPQQLEVVEEVKPEESGASDA
jgi:hypothetical protein